MNERGKAGEMGTKRCPRCGEELFEDMDVCYGCLYDFTREGAKEGARLDDPSPRSASAGTAVASDLPWVLEIGAAERTETHDVPEEAMTCVRSIRTEGSGLSVRIRSQSMEVTLPMPRDGLLVGRGSVCDVILHARAVSRHHVRIVPRGNVAIVEDCGSTNHAKLRGQEVEGSMTMEVGDVLDVCGTLFFLQEGTRS